MKDIKVIEFATMREYKKYIEARQDEGYEEEIHVLHTTSRGGKPVIQIDITTRRRNVPQFLKACRKAWGASGISFDFDAWLSGWDEEWKTCGDISSYSGREDGGYWSYSFGFEREDGYMYLFLNCIEG